MEALKRIADRYAVFLSVFLVGVTAASLACLYLSQSGGLKGAIGIGGLIFLAAGGVGVIVGFIFAVPRLRPSKDGQGEGRDGRLMSSNSSLERISDWLATMLVGVGLSQILQIPAFFTGFQQYLAQNAAVFVIAGKPSAGNLPMVGSFLLVLGAGTGFVVMYLHTRIVLAVHFLAAEKAYKEADDDAGSGALGGALQSLIARLLPTRRRASRD